MKFTQFLHCPCICDLLCLCSWSIKTKQQDRQFFGFTPQLLVDIPFHLVAGVVLVAGAIQMITH